MDYETLTKEFKRKGVHLMNKAAPNNQRISLDRVKQLLIIEDDVVSNKRDTYVTCVNDFPRVNFGKIYNYNFKLTEESSFNPDVFNYIPTEGNSLEIVIPFNPRLKSLNL